VTVWPSRERRIPPPARRATLRDLRRWQRCLSSLHTRACAVSDEADEILGSESEEAVLISDPIIELHVALNVVESLIAERLAARKDRP
jgi:hypothetical protein